MSDQNLRDQADFSGFEEQEENLSPTAAAQRQQFINRIKVNIACQRLRMEIQQLESRRHIEQKYLILDRLLPQLVGPMTGSCITPEERAWRQL